MLTSAITIHPFIQAADLALKLGEGAKNEV
jgi:hypothetical protein